MLDIVIVNWNSGAYLKTCIESINNEFQIIVVDNNSTDNSVSSISAFKNVTLLRQSENLGFGKACNIGANLAKSDFILFLNPDAAIYSDTIDKVLAFMGDATNDQIGICGVQLIDEYGNIARHCSRFPSVLRFLAQPWHLIAKLAIWSRNERMITNQLQLLIKLLVRFFG